MKNKIKFFIIPLITIIFFALNVNCCAAYSDVKRCDISVTADPNGTVTVSQEWTVEFKSGSDDNFSITVPIVDDARYYFSEFRDISLSIDGVSCANIGEEQTGQTVADVEYTYYISSAENGMNVVWNKFNDGNSHIFRLTYSMADCVKIIDDEAVLYCGYLSGEDAGKCESVSVNIVYPQGCEDKNINILTKNKYICKKNGNCVVFTGGKEKEDVLIGIGMPVTCFSGVNNYTTSPQGMTVFEIILLISVAVIIAGCVLLFVFSDKVSKMFFLKKCGNKPFSESSYKSQKLVFNELEPAEIIKITDFEECHDADLFTSSVMSLFQKGLLKTEDGKIKVVRKKVPLKPFEKTALSFFKKDITDTLDFYLYIKKFNKAVKSINIFQCVVPKYYELEKKCWEIYLSHESFDDVSLDKISVSAFKEGRVTPYEIVIGFVKDNSSDSHCKSGLCAFRAVYDDGKKEFLRIKSEKREKVKKIYKK